MKTGKFITQLSGDLQYKAFVPDPLPLDIEFDPVLQDLLSKADIALGRLDGIAEVVPDVDFFILMYIKKEAARSSQIEGTQATFCDLLKAEARIEDAEMHQDVDEIRNYIDAMNYGLKRLSELPISVRLIREIHEILLRGVRGAHKNPGAFRTSQNWVGGASIQTATYVPPPPHEVMPLMSNLEKFLHGSSPLPVLIKAGLMHVQFESIHPFLDGNGRIGRLLITFYLCQQKVLHKPLLYLSAFFKHYRREYYDKLHAVRTEENVMGWLKFFLTGVADTSEKAVETARSILILREGNTKKVAGLGRSSSSGLVLLRELYRRPMVRIKDIEQITTLKNPNALALLKKFEKLGILKEITGRKRNRVYSYEAYIKLFEEDFRQ